MGMDVYGKNPKSDAGEYFRRNVWGWHPLWEYVENKHPEIANLVEHAHTNDGDGLNATKSKKLAQLLFADLASGAVDEYVSERNKALSELPFHTCDNCEGTGIRTDEVGKNAGMPEKELEPDVQIIVGREKGWCNSCQGIGKREDFATWYYLEVEDVKDFAEFLQDCGGFEIC